MTVSVTHPLRPAPAPTVSVVMSAYNAEAYLAEALDSVLGQTLTDFELLLVDDGSTDDTSRIIERYACRDARIKAIHLERNGGVAHAKNIALALAQAPFIAVCDADDRQMPQRLESQVAALEEDTERVMVGCHVCPFGDAAADQEVWLPVEDDLARARILYQILYGDAANMFRRDLVIRHGLNYPAGALWEDWAFQVKALRYGSVHVLPGTLLMYRRHADQETGPTHGTADRTRTTMRHVLREAGVLCEEAELELHYAISPNPFGQLSHPDYVLRHQDDLMERAEAWLERLTREATLSGWANGAALERVAEEILRRLHRNISAAQHVSSGQTPRH